MGIVGLSSLFGFIWVPKCLADICLILFFRFQAWEMFMLSKWLIYHPDVPPFNERYFKIYNCLIQEKCTFWPWRKAHLHCPHGNHIRLWPSSPSVLKETYFSCQLWKHQNTEHTKTQIQHSKKPCYSQDKIFSIY